LYEIFKEGWRWAIEQNFGGDPVMDPNTDPDQYCDIGKTCLGGGVQCPSDSGYYDYFFSFLNK